VKFGKKGLLTKRPLTLKIRKEPINNSEYSLIGVTENVT